MACMNCGLIGQLAGGAPVAVPLTGVSVDVRIVDLVAEVTIEQRYQNRELQPIEAVYKFPLDEGAGVCQFTAQVDDRIIEGVVKENEEAKAEFRSAVQCEKTAFIMEEKLHDVFKAKVGNLAPGSGAKIRLTYVTELKVEGEEVRFYLPTTIAPRYVSPKSTPFASNDADLASIQYRNWTDYNLDLKTQIEMRSDIKQIRCPTHRITIIKGDVSKATVALEGSVTAMDRDLVLYIETVNPHKPRLTYEKAEDGSGSLMLSLVPSLQFPDAKAEFIFVIDRSGSMAGPSILQAKQAFKLLLQSLPVDCYVNVIGFGSSFQTFFPCSLKYDDRVLFQAKYQAEHLNADMGETEIMEPLRWIFNQPILDGYRRQIFLLTDGEVSFPDQVISLVHANRAQTRVFALGLGSSASHHLVEGVARAGNGTALFASLDEKLEKKVLQQLKDSLQPSLTDVKIKWEGYDNDGTAVQNVPVQREKTLMGYGKPLEPAAEKEEPRLRQIPEDNKIPAIFDGKQMVIYALLKENATVPKSATITAATPDGDLETTISLNPSDCIEGKLVHRLAAKTLIGQLQETEALINSNKEEIIKLGCRYGLASRHTSFIAVDPKERRSLTDSCWMMMKSRDVPLQVHGWGGSYPFGGAQNSPAVPFGANVELIGHVSSRSPYQFGGSSFCAAVTPCSGSYSADSAPRSCGSSDGTLFGSAKPSAVFSFSSPSHATAQCGFSPTCSPSVSNQQLFGAPNTAYTSGSIATFRASAAPATFGASAAPATGATIGLFGQDSSSSEFGQNPVTTLQAHPTPEARPFRGFGTTESHGPAAQPTLFFGRASPSSPGTGTPSSGVSLFGAPSSRASLFGAPAVQSPRKQFKPFSFNDNSSSSNLATDSSSNVSNTSTLGESVNLGDVESDVNMSDNENDASPNVEPLKTESKAELDTVDEKLIRLISIQSYDGSFRMDSILARLLKTSMAEIQEAGQNCKTSQVWATFLALAYLKVGLADVQDSWSMVAKKAEDWMTLQLVGDEAAFKEKAEQFVKAAISKQKF